MSQPPTEPKPWNVRSRKRAIGPGRVRSIDALRASAIRIPKLRAAIAALVVALVSAIAPIGLRAQTTPPQQDALIRKVDVEGLRRIPASEVLSRLSEKIRLGERYRSDVVDEETRRLYMLGKFRSVEPRVTPYEDGVAITFVVEEKPYVYRVRFIGNRYFSEGELAGRDTGLLTREGDLFSEYWLHQDRRTLHEKYVRSGFLFAEVDVDYAIDESGANVVFRLNEGTRARVHEVRFVGNRAISDTDLRAQMSTREKDFFFGILRPGFFIEEDFRDDLLRLKAYYISHGYFDVRVELESFELSPDKTELYLTIRIDEGPVYTFRGYRFSGNAVFTEQTLLSLTVAEPGTPYHRDTIERDRKAIESYYADRAYVFARVNPEPEFSMSPAEVWVRLDIQEENQIHIGEIKIQNNERTKDDVIRRELRIYPGELVNNSKMIESRSNLARLGIFRDITFSYEGTGARRDVIVRVEEERSGQLIVGFGVTSGFGIIGNISITKRNFDITDWPESIYDLPDHFTGAGQTLHLVIQPGTRRSLYRATFIEPYIFGTKNELSLSAASLTLIREDWDEDRASFEPRVSHRFDFDPDFQASIGLRLENVEVEDLDPTAPAVVRQSEGHSAVIAVNTSVAYSKVLYEPIEGPYDGHREVIFYEYAGGFLGGDLNFHRVEVSNDFFFPLYVHEEQNLHHVFSISNRLGFIEPHGSDDFIPVFERYFLGGPLTVRGFRFRGLGPHENGTPFGGTAKLHGNIEYVFPIFGKTLRGVIFFDWGNLGEGIDDLDFSHMRTAVGGGIRLSFPFLGGMPLPIGLYFGVPLRKEPEDRKRLFLFTIGTPFL